MSNQPPTHRFLTTSFGNDYGGESQASPNTKIRWAPVTLSPGVQSEGATVADVLAACVARMSQIQKTPQASDTNARALWEVQKAMDLLNGQAPAVGAGFGGSDSKPGT
jgi:hypothetical protein